MLRTGESCAACDRDQPSSGSPLWRRVSQLKQLDEVPACIIEDCLYACVYGRWLLLKYHTQRFQALILAVDVVDAKKVALENMWRPIAQCVIIDIENLQLICITADLGLEAVRTTS